MSIDEARLNNRLAKVEQDVKELECLAGGGHYWQTDFDGGLFTCSHCSTTYFDPDYWARKAVCIGTAEDLQHFFDKQKEGEQK